ncbi:hypothetical protein [Xylophilus sp.]|uniref:hypothetical protein n=1 Tax=Xylophilus sp. TaxID=2653893 RepID=UPI002D7F6C44|nr:hypothetical protein [Xylophilus sp.]
MPLHLHGALVDAGRPMTRSEGLRLTRTAYGPAAWVVRTTDSEGRREWRALV